MSVMGKALRGRGQVKPVRLVRSQKKNSFRMPEKRNSGRRSNRGGGRKNLSL